MARYIRVSRLDQNPQLQVDETLAFVERRGWALVDTFVDHGISGSKEKRPELDRMMAAARKGKFDIILAWRSDRLFRSLRAMVNTLAEFEAIGVGFVSATEVFDSTTPQGRLLGHLVSAFAEFERQTIIERTRAGLASAKRRGKVLGRPRVVVDLDRARALRQGGSSLRAVARELGVSLGTVQKALGGVQQSSPEVLGSEGGFDGVSVPS